MGVVVRGVCARLDLWGCRACCLLSVRVWCRGFCGFVPSLLPSYPVRASCRRAGEPQGTLPSAQGLGDLLHQTPILIAWEGGLSSPTGWAPSVGGRL